MGPSFAGCQLDGPDVIHVGRKSRENLAAATRADPLVLAAEATFVSVYLVFSRW